MYVTMGIEGLKFLISEKYAGFLLILYSRLKQAGVEN